MVYQVAFYSHLELWVLHVDPECETPMGCPSPWSIWKPGAVMFSFFSQFRAQIELGLLFFISWQATSCICSQRPQLLILQLLLHYRWLETGWDQWLASYSETILVKAILGQPYLPHVNKHLLPQRTTITFPWLINVPCCDMKCPWSSYNLLFHSLKEFFFKWGLRST